MSMFSDPIDHLLFTAPESGTATTSQAAPGYDSADLGYEAAYCGVLTADSSGAMDLAFTRSPLEHAYL